MVARRQHRWFPRQVVLALALAGGALLPASAHATVAVTKMVATPITSASACSTVDPVTPATRAGEHNDFCVAMAFDGGGNQFGGGDDVRDMRISVAKGMVGAPSAATPCTDEQFQADQCTVANQLGDASAAVETLIPLGENLLRGRVYNLKPLGTEPARLGVAVGLQVGGIFVPQMRMISEIRLRPADAGIDTVITDAPRDAFGIPIELRRIALRLWGAKADHPSLQSSFLSTATDCSGPATTSISLTSYDGNTTDASASFTPTDCASLDMPVQAAIETETAAADSPTGVSAVLTAPDLTEGRSPALTKNAILTLPQGFELSASAGSDGLDGCADAQFGQGTGAPVTCPAGSQVGTVDLRSPLLPGLALVGRVYIGNPTPAAPLRLFIIAETGPEPDATRVKLTATATINPQTGQITTVIDDLPPVPFTLFKFNFRGGPTALLATPRACGTYAADIRLEAFSDNLSEQLHPTAVIDQGCQATQPFAPELHTDLSSTQAGADTSVVATISVPDRNARLSGATITLPAGLTGRLGSVAACPVEQARAAACSADSLIGSAVATAGVGPRPLSLGGRIYLVGPFDGAVAGAAIVAPAKLGPIDLGNIVVLAKIVPQNDGSLQMIVDHVPARLAGIAPVIRAIRLSLDRPGFLLNGTGCDARQMTATLTADTGATADLTAPYQATGCDQLKFTPQLEATLPGKRSELKKGKHPEVDVQFSVPAGQSNVRSLKLTLPAGLEVDLARLKGVCSAADYAATACPDSALMGLVEAHTPLLPIPLTGKVFLVMQSNSALPAMRIQLRGLLNLDLPGTVEISQENRLITSIDPVPDVPLSSLSLVLGKGGTGPIVFNHDPCQATRTAVDGTVTGQAGPTAKIAVRVQLPACTPQAQATIDPGKDGQPTLDLRLIDAGRGMRAVRAVLPDGLTFKSGMPIREMLQVSRIGNNRATLRARATGHVLTLTIPRPATARILRIRVRNGALESDGEQHTARLRLRVTRTNGRATNLRVTARPPDTTD